MNKQYKCKLKFYILQKLNKFYDSILPFNLGMDIKDGYIRRNLRKKSGSECTRNVCEEFHLSLQQILVVRIEKPSRQEAFRNFLLSFLNHPDNQPDAKIWKMQFSILRIEIFDHQSRLKDSIILFFVYITIKGICIVINY